MVNLAPDLNKSTAETSEDTSNPEASGSEQAQPPEINAVRARAELLQILGMLDDLEAEIEEE